MLEVLLVFGNIRKIKMTWCCYCYKILFVFCIFTAISVPQCINGHIKCSVVKPEVADRPKLTGNEYTIITKQLGWYVSVSTTLYTISWLPVSHQKVELIKYRYNSILSNAI